MKPTKTKSLDRIISLILTLMMVVSLLPVNVFASEETTSYGTVATFTGGEIKNNGTSNVEVIVNETNINWVDGNAYRAEGWWVGIKAIAPEGVSVEATYKSKDDPAGKYGAAKKIFNDGEDDYIELWFPISPDILSDYANAGRNLTHMYAFDWNADTVYEQEVTFSVVPSGKIVLMKGEEQIYPVITHDVTTYNVTVNKNEGGIVEVNGDENETTTVDRNSNVSIGINANEGYQISSVKIDGSEQSISSNATQYGATIENIRNDTKIEVSFVKVYTVTVAHTGNGTIISPENGGSVTVISGNALDVTAQPEEGNRVFSVVINGVEDDTVTRANDSGYSKQITADKDYTIEIAFASNEYEIVECETTNGSVLSKDSIVKYDGNTDIYLTPDNGFTVDTVKVNGVAVEDIIKDESGIYFNISNVKTNQIIEVTFKETAKAEKNDVLVNTDDALRVDKNLIVIKEGSDVVFSTDKSGIKVYNADGLVGGDASTKSVTVIDTMYITRIELYYQAECEYYADWHTVDMSKISVVVDKGDNVEASLTVLTPAVNGYYNSNVLFKVEAEDSGDYSGLALVEYWITYNDVAGATIKLYEYKNGEKIKNIFTDSEKMVVDASLYNSDNVKVTLHVVDRAGNEKTVNKALKINSTKPTVSLDINETKFDNAKDGYYNDKRELTITVIDRKDTFSKANVAAGLLIKRNGETVTVNANDIVWTDTDSLHIGKYTFDTDGHYEWSISYTNIAGLSNEGLTAPIDKNICDFYVDKAAPHTLNVSYETDFVGVLLENVTFGFYEAPIKVTIEATDDTAGIEQFEYYFTLEDGTGEINKTTVNGSDINRDGNRAYITFPIESQFRGKIAFSATDRAGRTVNLQDNRVVVVDTITPGITVTWNPVEGCNGKYFNADRTATIEIEEANFFAQDVEDELLKITAHIVYNDGSSKNETYKPDFTFEDGKHKAAITFDEEADYTFDVTYTDRSGNVYDEYPSEEFTIDKTAPVVSVKYDNNTAINENQFKTERTATVTVVEHNFNKNSMNVLVNENETRVEWIKKEGVADTYTAAVAFPGDDHYTFSVNGKDSADNVNDGVSTAEGTVAPWEFTVDKSGPVGLKISYKPTFVGTLLEGVTFGFYKVPATVKIEATDDISGIDYFTYSYTVQEGASNINVGKQNVKVDANGTDFITFEIPAQLRGFVSFIATNKAGVSASTADANAVVVDDIAPGIQVVYGNYDARNDKYYKSARTATIIIEEANFFAKDIEDGLLLITCVAVANDGTVKEETLSPQFTRIENSDKYVATIDFDQDADYTFDIKYTDRSGNVYDDYDADEFTVDTIAPKISIEKANGAYFYADRTAKITVVEHNFRPSDFSIQDAEGNLTITATDCIGTPIDLTSKGYEAYLKDDDNWTPVAPDTWEAEIIFDIEGNYSIAATYTDLAGNEQETPISDTFCVDKSNPENLKISYEPTFVGTLLEGVTFGFYKAPVTVTIEATDDIAGVDHFVYSYIVAEGASTTNTGKSNVTVQATRDESTNRCFTTFDIPAQFRGNISFTAFDKATNNKSITDGNVVIVDNVAPGVNVVYDNNNDYDDGYFKADRTATITINETNFFAKDIDDNLLVITVEKTLNDGTYTSTKMSPVFTKNGDIYTAEILFDENADYTFDIKYTDRSGNVYDSYKKDVFTIDKIDPVIDVEYEADELYENNNQFRTNRTATIKITEHNFRADYVVAKVIASGNEVARYAEYLKNEINWIHNGDIHTAVIEYTEEAHYTFEIGCTDKTGRTNEGIVNYGDSVSPAAFTIDKSAPTDMEIKIDNVSVAGSMTDLAFNKFYDATVAVKLSANCDISGLQSLKYQKVTNVADYKTDGIWTDYNAETGIVVSPSEKFIIYFRAEDRAGNVNIIRSTGIVVDNQKPSGETNAPEIDILPAKPNANGIHKGDVNVDLKVVDPKYTGTTATANGHYSGLNKITYKIYTTDTNAVEKGTLLELGKVTLGAVFDADNLVSSWTGKVTIDSEKFNSNNVIVEVTATDNAGNTRTTTTAAGNIKIDVTAPTINISYDNNAADRDGFFKANRTAKIVVTERNVKSDDVKVTFTNTDGVIPVLSGWTKTAGTGNLDDTTWTATVVYEADGDYEFAIEYTDLAENKCAGEVYADGTVAAKAFTIDKTPPVVSVSYSNNDARNGKYFAAPRTATVVVNEHNFNVNRVTFKQTATLDGAPITIPSAAWENHGDIHTATIAFAADGDYTFDVSVMDNAGNVCDAVNYGNSVAAKDFVVDQTIVKPTIGGIENGKAYKDVVIPTISFNDVNYDSYEIKLVRTRMEEKNIDVTDEFIKFVTEQSQGGSGSFDTFEKTVENDGIYTLSVKMTDKAGNNAVQEYTFTVNRYGSVYEYGDYLISLIKDGGQYITKNGNLAITEDLVITEYNADRLVEDSLKIIITRDGETIDVKYTSSPEITNGVEVGSSGWYQYMYTISKDNFTVDGVYNITISFRDATQNTSTNVPDNSIDKDGNRILDIMTFTVDTTAPEIRNIINLDKKIVNAQELTVKYTVVDVGGLKQIEVLVDSKTVDTITEFGDALNNFTGEFTLSESSEAQTVRIKVTDKAGNVTDTASEDFNSGDLYIFNDTITVSTNAFVRWYANKPLFWGSIGGIVVLVGLLGFLVAAIRRKKESKAK